FANTFSPERLPSLPKVGPGNDFKWGGGLDRLADWFRKVTLLSASSPFGARIAGGGYFPPDRPDGRPGGQSPSLKFAVHCDSLQSFTESARKSTRRGQGRNLPAHVCDARALSPDRVRRSCA